MVFRELVGCICHTYILGPGLQALAASQSRKPLRAGYCELSRTSFRDVITKQTIFVTVGGWLCADTAKPRVSCASVAIYDPLGIMPTEQGEQHYHTGR